jgi:hypothetical protein
MPVDPTYRVTSARQTGDWRVLLHGARPLHYDGGADPVLGLPAHVRAASALRRRGTRVILVQDDVNAIAVLDATSGVVRSVVLPAATDDARVFDDARGNKKHKMDLEACVALPDGRLVALGSGSSPRRERLVVLDDEVSRAEVREATSLYGRLRALADQRGAELNVEGAALQGDRLWLAQRGHGKRATAQWNALLDIPLEAFVAWLDGHAPAPPVRSVIEVRLGRSTQGVLFGFTDVALAVDGRLAFLACAEDSVDVRMDGPVSGCRFGWLDASTLVATTTDVLEADGRPTTLKLEGLESRPGSAVTFDVVADMDRPEEPALLAELRLESVTS